MTPVRVAFLTQEFVTEFNAGGGLGNYVFKMCQALQGLGHVPEVFVVTRLSPGVIDHEGVRTVRVPPRNMLPLRVLSRVSRLHPRTSVASTCRYIRGARGLANALERRHAEEPFDLVQSSNFGLTGIFVKSALPRVHAVRCTWAAELFLPADGVEGLDPKLTGALERRCLRRADVAYAPSRFLADYYREHYQIDVRVIRPPAVEPQEVVSTEGVDLPPRYFTYLGQISRRKGADVLAEALTIAWKSAPDLRMVWMGAEARHGEMGSCFNLWNDRARNVSWLGPVEKPLAHSILTRGEATVVPSRVDNLPNAAIESLMSGVPIIGSRGASVDELISNEREGETFPIGDADALASALVRRWKSPVAKRDPVAAESQILNEMAPANAVARLLEVLDAHE